MHHSRGHPSGYCTVRVTVQPVIASMTWGDQPPGSGPSYSEALNVDDAIDNPDGLPDNQEPSLVANSSEVRSLQMEVNTVLPAGSTFTLSGR